MSTAPAVASHIIYVIGCPGAGKGTLCTKLALRLEWAHISVGHELRDHVRRNDESDDTVVKCVQSGTLVPVVQLGKILQHRMEELRGQGYTSFILDGFPRSVDQIEFMQDLLDAPDQVIYMECPKDIARVRVLTRKDTSRVDDEDLFERRFTEFCANNPAIVAYFEARNKLRTVNTSYETDVSFGQLLTVLEIEDCE